MGKYSDCLTTKQVCKLECKEAESILEGYSVSKEDVTTILEMIKEPYYQLGIQFEDNDLFAKFVCEKYSIDEKQLSVEFIRWVRGM